MLYLLYIIHTVFQTELEPSGAEEVAQLVNRLLGKHEELSSDLQNACEKPPSMRALVYNPCWVGRDGQTPTAPWPVILASSVCSRPKRNHVSKKKDRRAGEMAQQLRALIALPEDLGSVPSTDMATHSCL